MSTGYNWRNTLTHFAAISGVLAGFSITFIALILGGPVANIKISFGGIYIGELTYGQVAVLLFGVSTGLFVCATELFLRATEFDVFSIPEPYRELLREGCEVEKKDWTKFEDEQTKQCRDNERLGRKCYNFAIFILFFGLFFVIVPYTFLIALVVSGLGLLLETWQIFR
jgi:hypothetical protein